MYLQSCQLKYEVLALLGRYEHRLVVIYRRFGTIYQSK